MPKQYRVRRTHPNDYAQNQATSLKECQQVLRGLRDKWREVAVGHNPGFGYQFRVTEAPRSLEVHKDHLEGGNVVREQLVDKYIIEEAK